jgi:hypothetical protein
LTVATAGPGRRDAMMFMPGRGDVERDAEAMIRQYGSDAPLRAVEQLNARIEVGDEGGRDHWAQVVHAIHALTGRSPQRQAARPTSNARVA